MAYLVIAGITSVIFIVNAIFATVPGYRVAPALLIPLMGVAYLLRNKLEVTPFGYGLFASALVLHDLGAYGYYQRFDYTRPITFDMWVHFYFALAGTFILHRAMKHHLPWKGWQVALATVLFVMGVGAIHEIMEYSTYLVLGEERGMLKPSTSYRFDNERDLMCNLAGCILAIACAAGWRLISGRRSRPV